MKSQLQLVILSILSPILALYISLKAKRARLVVFGFVLIFFYFGLFISFTNLQDGYRHRLYVVENYFDMSFGEFASILFKILTFTSPAGYKPDVYLHLIAYISALLGSENLVHVFASVLMGFFVGKTFVNFKQYLYSKNDPQRAILKLNISSLVIISVIFLHYSLSGVNSIRAWSGMWFVYYVSSEIYLKNNRAFTKYLILAPLFHFMYLPFSLLMLMYYYFGSRFDMLIILVFLISFMVPALNIDAASLVPEIELFQEKKEVYYKSKEEVINYQKSTSFINILFSGSSLYANAILLVTNFILPLLAFILLWFRKKLDSATYRLFVLGLLIYAISNLFSFSIPSITGRYRNISFFFFIIPFMNIVFCSNIPLRTRRHLSNAMAISLLPYLVYSISIILGYMSPYSLIGPFIGVIEDEYLSIKAILTLL